MVSRYLIALLFCGAAAAAQDIEHLPGTKPLKFDGDDLSEWVMDGAHLFVERKIREATTNRSREMPCFRKRAARRKVTLMGTPQLSSATITLGFSPPNTIARAQSFVSMRSNSVLRLP